MRKAFVKTLTEIVENDKNVILITADLGFTVFDEFKEIYPKNFLNCGVAEANGIGIAAGLALSGKTVFIYSIIPFITMRCYEQIRNDLCYHNLNVILVGIGGGYSYGVMGTTHHAIEDIGLLRLQPNMFVVCPGDPIEVEYATKKLTKRQGPSYLRLGKIGEKVLHNNNINFELGKSICLKDGKDMTLIATGNMLETALQASSRLFSKGINARVLSMHTIKPIDTEAIYNAAYETQRIYTIEEHSVIGGLGSTVAEVLAQSKYHTDFLMFGIKDQFMHVAGTQNYLRNLNEINVDQIVKKIIDKLK